MDFLQGEYINDAFQTALVKLYDAVSEERNGAQHLVSQWAGVKKSTLYSWMSGEDTPADWRCIWRLAIRSQQAGYSHFIEALAAGDFAVRTDLETHANGCLTDEARECDKAWGKIWRGEESGNAEVVRSGGHELARIGERVVQESKLME